MLYRWCHGMHYDTTMVHAETKSTTIPGKPIAVFLDGAHIHAVPGHQSRTRCDGPHGGGRRQDAASVWPCVKELMG